MIYDVPVEPFGINNGLLIQGELFDIRVSGAGSVNTRNLFHDHFIVVTTSNGIPTTGNTIESELDLTPPYHGLAGLNLYLSRIEFETLSYTPQQIGFTETHFVYRLYGEPGELPEPSTAVLFVTELRGFHGYQRRKVSVNVRGSSAPVPSSSTST